MFNFCGPEVVYNANDKPLVDLVRSSIRPVATHSENLPEGNVRQHNGDVLLLGKFAMRLLVEAQVDSAATSFRVVF